MQDGSGSPYSRFDFPDFAQEFLRRNPVYQDEYHELIQRNNASTQQLRSSGVANFWGLEFLD